MPVKVTFSLADRKYARSSTSVWTPDDWADGELREWVTAFITAYHLVTRVTVTRVTVTYTIAPPPPPLRQALDDSDVETYLNLPVETQGGRKFYLRLVDVHKDLTHVVDGKRRLVVSDPNVKVLTELLTGEAGLWGPVVDARGLAAVRIGYAAPKVSFSGRPRRRKGRGGGYYYQPGQ
jgi:hypothetical protein